MSLPLMALASYLSRTRYGMALVHRATRGVWVGFWCSQVARVLPGHCPHLPPA